MARLPRLAVGGALHHVMQRGHDGHPVFRDDADRRLFLSLLSDAARAEAVAVHAYALLDSEIHLLATPAQAANLGRLMQAVGRRYVSAFNRRHQRRGTLWDGRFRSSLIDPASCSKRRSMSSVFPFAPSWLRRRPTGRGRAPVSISVAVTTQYWPITLTIGRSATRRSRESWCTLTNWRKACLPNLPRALTMRYGAGTRWVRLGLSRGPSLRWAAR